MSRGQERFRNQDSSSCHLLPYPGRLNPPPTGRLSWSREGPPFLAPKWPPSLPEARESLAKPPKPWWRLLSPPFSPLRYISLKPTPLVGDLPGQWKFSQEICQFIYGSQRERGGSSPPWRHRRFPGFFAWLWSWHGAVLPGIRKRGAEAEIRHQPRNHASLLVY